MPAAKYKIPIKLFLGIFLIFEVNVGIIYCPVMQCKMINLLRLWKLFRVQFAFGEFKVVNIDANASVTNKVEKKKTIQVVILGKEI